MKGLKVTAKYIKIISGIITLVYLSLFLNFCSTLSYFNYKCHAAASKISIEDQEIEVIDISGKSYISLKTLAGRIKLNVKYSDATKVYSLKDRSSGREFKFAVDKRVIISGSNFYKSKSPIVKIGDDVKLPLEMISEIYKIKQLTSDDEETDDTEDDDTNVKKETQTPAASDKTNAKNLTQPQLNDKNDAVKTTTETEIKKEEKNLSFILENIKYKRGKDSFELDINFNQKPEQANFKISESSDKKSIDITIMSIESKIFEQTVKISDSIINTIKLNAPDKTQKTRKIIVSAAEKTFNITHSIQDNILKIKFTTLPQENKISEITAAQSTSAVEITTSEISILPPKKTSEVAVIDAIKPAKDLIDESELKKNLENLKFTIAIDPGHGGEDFGVISPGNLKEKDLTLDMARRLKELFDKTPLKSVLIRMGDYYMPYENRVSVANSYGAGLLISLHAGTAQSGSAAGVGIFYNGQGNSRTQGFLISMGTSSVILNNTLSQNKIEAEVEAILRTIDAFNKTEESQKIARYINELMRKNIKIKLRKSRETNLSLLSDAVIPGIVIEIGFLSNADDEKLLSSNEYKDEMAKIIFEGIKKYIYSSKMQKQ